MTQIIKLNRTDGFDLESLVSSRLLIQANSGGGKSWVLRRILEQSHGKIQQIVIDSEGEFASLREKYDYILVAKKDGDIRAEAKTARKLAHRLLELNVSVIVDLYELKHQERKHIGRYVLAERVNMTGTGGSFNTYLSTLRSNCLIEEDGQQLKLSDDLFVDQ